MEPAWLKDLGVRLVRGGWRLATAESCTGGLVAHWITSIAGCSQWYCGGVVAYADSTKHALLGVDEELLRCFGAVSEPVAEAMAKGVCRQIPAADLGVGITGIAGPGGGSIAKPVGLVYVGFVDPSGQVTTRKLQLAGRREEIQIAAGKAALQMIYDFTRDAACS